MVNKMIVKSAAQNIDRVKSFYNRIQFINIASNPTYWYDGQTIIQTDINPAARVALQLYTDHYKALKDALEDQSDIIIKDTHYEVADPNGVIFEIHDAQKYPSLVLPEAKEPSSLLGKCFGLGIETFHFERSLEFYKRIGYNIPPYNDEGYISCTKDGILDITLYKPGMCPHSFFNPSLTYFNGKEGNPKLIKKMRDRNILFTEEITVFSTDQSVDNVVVEDGGGLHFFVFNDG